MDLLAFRYQVWDTETPNIEPGGYQQIRAGGLVDSAAICLSSWVLIHWPMYVPCCLEWTVPRGCLRPQDLCHAPGRCFPKLFNQKKPPSVSTCHSNWWCKETVLRGRGQKGHRLAPLLCFPRQRVRWAQPGARLPDPLLVSTCCPPWQVGTVAAPSAGLWPKDTPADN